MRYFVGACRCSLAVLLVACGSSDKGDPDASGGSAGMNAESGGETSANGGKNSGGKAGTAQGGASAGSSTHGGDAMGGHAAGGSSPGGSTGAGGKTSAMGGTSAGGASHKGGATGSSSSDWQNATGNLANMASECGNLGLVSAQPGSDMIVAGVAQKGLWATHDGGETWTALGSGSGSAKITNRISTIIWDPDHAGTFWESGIYNGSGVYKTTDNGVTFTAVGDVNHNDSLSIDLSDPDRKTMLAGGHETAAKLYLSTNAGSTWKDIGASLPMDAGFCTSTLVLDANTLLVGCTGNGVYRSTNGGGSWSRVGMTGVSPQPLVAANGTIYWSASQGGVQKSAADGKSFTTSADAGKSASAVAPTTLAELPDGRIVTVGPDHLQASDDQGATWNPIGPKLPFTGGGFAGASGVTYSAMTKRFFIWHWNCDNAVLPDAIMRLDFDYTTQ